MRLILVTMGVLMATMLVLGFALADLSRVAKDHRNRNERRAERKIEPVNVGVPADSGAQVRTLVFLFRHFPERARKQVTRFPASVVTRSLVILHRTEKQPRRRMQYLEQLARHPTQEGRRYLEQVSRQGTEQEMQAARSLLESLPEAPASRPTGADPRPTSRPGPTSRRG